MVHEIEDFYGVYLLYCQNPRFSGHTYIGYTVDPNRRIKQHNSGSHAGGAWRTSGRGPWEMVLIIHGFPNTISALRFEWAWQHPEKCRRLREVPVAKRRSESAFQYRWRMVCHMLHSGPWNRLALTVRWLKQDLMLDFPTDLAPPLHMHVAFGPVRSKRIQGIKDASLKKLTERPPASSNSTLEGQSHAVGVVIPAVTKKHPLCAICDKKLKENGDRVACQVPKCTMVSHMTCLAHLFLGAGDAGHMIPVEGKCPGCGTQVLWGDVIRHYNGCYQDLTQAVAETDTLSQLDGVEGHWADNFNT